MTKLTEHFSLDEFIASSTADAHGIANTPTPEHLKNIKHTAECMEGVRALFNRSIVAGSGYRNPEVNALVGGVATSDHAQGLALDFHVAGYSDYEAARIISKSKLKWDQLIFEKGRCVHMGFGKRMRQQVLSQPGGPGSPVLQGIVP